MKMLDSLNERWKGDCLALRTVVQMVDWTAQKNGLLLGMDDGGGCWRLTTAVPQLVDLVIQKKGGMTVLKEACHSGWLARSLTETLFCWI